MFFYNHVIYCAVIIAVLFILKKHDAEGNVLSFNNVTVRYERLSYDWERNCTNVTFEV